MYNSLRVETAYTQEMKLHLELLLNNTKISPCQGITLTCIFECSKHLYDLTCNQYGTQSILKLLPHQSHELQS